MHLQNLQLKNIARNNTSEPKKWRIANLRYFNPVGRMNRVLGDNPTKRPANLFPAIINFPK